MIHYCGMPIALTAPHCKIPELSNSHVLHLEQRVGNGAVCLWRAGSCQREASHSLFLPLPLALPQSVPVLCNIQSWLNSLSFSFPSFVLTACFCSSSSNYLLFSHFSSLPFLLPLYHFFIFSLFSALHGRYDLHPSQAEAQLQCLWDWGFG